MLMLGITHRKLTQVVLKNRVSCVYVEKKMKEWKEKRIIWALCIRLDVDLRKPQIQSTLGYQLIKSMFLFLGSWEVAMLNGRALWRVMLDYYCLPLVCL